MSKYKISWQEKANAISVNPDMATRDDIAKLTIDLTSLIATRILLCANSGGFNNAISHLNSLALIVRQNGNIKLNPEALEK